MDRIEVIFHCGKCDKDLLPIEDVTQSGQVFLKGWICSNPDCANNIIFKGGNLFRLKITEERER